MLHVGLTGNIASGKSQAAQIFAELGAHIIDADAIAHDLLARAPICRKVIESFGEGILAADGSIDRKKLGEIVFNDASKRAELNRALHPEVAAEVLRRTVGLEQRLPGAIIIVEAALLIESGRHDLYNKLIVVTCDPNLQLSRLIARNGLTSQQARARMEAQMPVEEKLKYADYTIETSGTLRETREQIEAVYRDLLVQEMMSRSGFED